MTAMRVDAFDFVLPPERIALAPANPRDSARMLVVGADGELDGRVCARSARLSLRPGDALVVNDTRVIAARLDGVRVRGEAIASIEATLIERVDDCRWRALARPAKRLKVGERIRFGEASESMACLLAALDAEVEDKGEAGEVVLRFEFAGAALDEAIERLGAPPLPPYIASRRALSSSDRCRLPDDVRSQIRGGGGADGRAAFYPVAGSRASRRAAWRCTGSRCTSAQAPSRRSGSRIRATTRCIPSGVRSTPRQPKRSTPCGQREAGSSASARRPRASSRAPPTTNGRLQPFSGRTDIFITPGYEFRCVDALMTNFHLPRSTLFMLVSAFSGLETMRAAYAHAIQAGYRFYSYGDACLLTRAAAASLGDKRP